MQPCDVNGRNCAGQAEDHQLCGSCMRNVCDNCQENLTTVSDDYGNYYLVPESLGNEESFGNVPVCPSCAHLELFKTSTHTNKNLALEHILSEHPEGNLEDVQHHGELDDYHDALHYGDHDEETRGVADYPSDHPQDDDANFKVALRIRGEESKEVSCPTCSSVGLPILNRETGERWCSNCNNGIPSEPKPEPEPEPEAKSRSTAPKTFVPTDSGLLVPGGSAPTSAPSGGPVSKPKESPLYVPIEPLTDGSNYPQELHPDTPLDISPHLDFIQQHGGATPHEAAGIGSVPTDHPYAAHAAASGVIRDKDLKRYHSGKLTHEEVFGMNMGYGVAHPRLKKDLKSAITAVGGLDENGAPRHGVHEDHQECEAQGGTKLYDTGIVCHRCSKMIDPKGVLHLNSSISARPSPYDSPEQKAKSLAAIDLIQKQHGLFADVNERRRKYKVNPQTGELQKIKREHAGRPSFEERHGDFIGFVPPEPSGGTYKFHNKGKKIAHKELSEEDIERAYRASVKPRDFDASTAHVHTSEGRIILEDGSLIDSASSYGQKKQ